MIAQLVNVIVDAVDLCPVKEAFMLKMNKRNIMLATLCSIGCVLISSCGNNASDIPLFGIIEGTYYYESQEGALPEGWSFGKNSKFEFVEMGPPESYDKRTTLENGSWQMQKFTIGEDGVGQVNSNCKMVWSNTPFDTMSYLKVAGTYKTSDNVATMVMISPIYSLNDTWGDVFKGIDCAITPLEKNDYSKRKISISFIQNNETENKLIVTFSM